MCEPITSGSAGYRLTDDERAVEHIQTGRRYPLRGRALDIYRVLSLRRGYPVTSDDLIDIIWHGCALAENVTTNICRLRRAVAPDVVESVGYPWGYIVR